MKLRECRLNIGMAFFLKVIFDHLENLFT